MRIIAFLCACLILPSISWGQWELVREDKERDIRVYSQAQASNAYDAFYAVTHVNVPLSTAVAVLADVSAMPEWFARLKQVSVLKKEAGKELWVYTLYQLPYPFKARDAVLYSQLNQDQKTEVVTVTVRALPKYVPIKKDVIRLKNMSSTWKLTPQKNGQIKVELWGEGDPEGNMPSWLFNYNLADEPMQTLRNFRRMVQRPKYQKSLPFIKDSSQPKG